jgi:2-aminoadipate transaminase
LADAKDIITFSGGFPAPETFPVDVLGELTEGLLAGSGTNALQYSPTEGLPSVRRAMADMVEESQGGRPDPDHLLVTSGGIEAMQLLSRVLIDPGDLVFVEAPTYLGAVMAFAGFEAEVRGIDMDEDGLIVDQLADALARGARPKLVYVIPDHQNPTGYSLSSERRRHLVELCRHHGVLLVEDVAYRELGFDGATRPSLWSLGPDVVVQIGTFSKIFFPGVRLGWAIGPETVVSAMTAAKQNSDQCAGALGQRLLEAFLATGGFEAHLKHAQGIYAARGAAMVSALEHHLGDEVEFTRPAGGFFVWLTANPAVDTEALCDVASARRVAYVPGRPFYVDGRGRNEIRLSFSRTSEEEIFEGIGRLAEVIRSAAG